jgi:predicted acyltransferase
MNPTTVVQASPALRPSRTPDPVAASERLVSIDALRGFDMFWIIGGEELCRALASATEWKYAGWVNEQLKHVEWDGFHFYDLIFPLFLFLVGAVLPFSLGKLYDNQLPTYRLYYRIIRRTILLFLLGLIYNGLFRLDWLVLKPNLHVDVSNIRIAGVLQRIAICYFFAALITLHTGMRGRAVVSVVLLLGYWALMALVPVQPPAGAEYEGRYSIRDNLGAYVDQHYLPGKHVKDYYEFGDNEGLLSTIPAIVTCLLGTMAGQWLRSWRAPWLKVFGLMAAGLVCLGLGILWGLWFPIIKNIWTSSFVLVAGGHSLILLAFFYAIIDVLRLRFWAFFFTVIGANAITIYVAKEIIPFEHIAAFFLGGAAKHSGKLYGEVVLTAGTIAVEWLFLLYLYRRRIFLRV